MDIDKLLNFEQECYDKGYKEGLSKGRIQGHTEGRELGIQTGFQRYLSMGILQARADIWAQEEGSIKEKAALAKLHQLVATPRLDNDPQVVENVAKNMKLAKNKSRSIAASQNSPPVNAHEQRIIYRRGDDEDGTAIEDMY